MRSARIGRAELELNVVRVAERQDVQPELWAEVLDAPMRRPARVEQAHGPREVVAAGHGEAEVVEPDPIGVPQPLERKVGIGL